MQKRKLSRTKLWVSTIAGLVGTIVACSDDASDEPDGAAGRGSHGGIGAIGGGGSSGGGAAGAGEGGTGENGGMAGAGEGGTGGMADAGAAGTAGGGASGCDPQSYEVLKEEDQTVARVIVWPDQHRVGILGAAGEGVDVYELEGGGVTPVETLGPEDLDLPEAGDILDIAAYGDGFWALVDAEPGGNVELQVVLWQRSTGVETILPMPEPGDAHTLVARDDRVAVSLGGSVFVARRDADTWAWDDPIHEPGRTLAPLALQGNVVFVGVRELTRLDDDPDLYAWGGAGGAHAGGQGGSGGAEPSSRSARVDVYVNGQPLERHEALGNPARAIELEVGEGNYLITETNSFWGSLRAALEVYGESGSLRRLTEVPVRSAGDGEDGAFDAALFGERLFVANCESGLLTGLWPEAGEGEPGDGVTLVPFEGPWSDSDRWCSPIEVEVLDGVLVVGGDNLVFARLCNDE
ncbi:MAG TPA: hypothetical protein VIM73_17495 [Polyangiaceae bacterium]